MLRFFFYKFSRKRKVFEHILQMNKRTWGAALMFHKCDQKEDGRAAPEMLVEQKVVTYIFLRD